MRGTAIAEAMNRCMMGESCRRCGRARPAGPSPRRRPPHSLGRPACTNIPPAQFTVRRWGRRDAFAGCRAGSWRRARTRACRGQRFSGRGRCAGRQLLVWNARALGGRGGSRPRMLWAGRGGSGGGGGGGGRAGGDDRAAGGGGGGKSIATNVASDPNRCKI